MSDTALPSRSGITIRRAASVGDDWGTLDIHYEGYSSMTLPPEGVRTVFLRPNPVLLDIERDGQNIFSEVLDMPADTKLDYSLELAPVGLLDRLLRRPPKLRLVETARAYLAPYDPGLYARSPSKSGSERQTAKMCSLI